MNLLNLVFLYHLCRHFVTGRCSPQDSSTERYIPCCLRANISQQRHACMNGTVHWVLNECVEPSMHLCAVVSKYCQQHCCLSCPALKCQGQGMRPESLAELHPNSLQDVSAPDPCLWCASCCCAPRFTSVAWLLPCLHVCIENLSKCRRTVHWQTVKAIQSAR